MSKEDQPPSELEKAENNSPSALERHSSEFHKLMEETLSKKDSTAYPMSIPSYNKRIEFSRKIRQGVPISKLRAENPQAYKWAKSYNILTIGGSETFVFREQPDKNGNLPAFDQYKKVVHRGNAFEKAHAVHVLNGSHKKARTFHNAVSALYGSSIPRWCTDLLCATCAICKEKSIKREKVKGREYTRPVPRKHRPSEDGRLFCPEKVLHNPGHQQHTYECSPGKQEKSNMCNLEQQGSHLVQQAAQSRTATLISALAELPWMPPQSKSKVPPNKNSSINNIQPMDAATIDNPFLTAAISNDPPVAVADLVKLNGNSGFLTLAAQAKEASEWLQLRTDAMRRVATELAEAEEKRVQMQHQQRQAQARAKEAEEQARSQAAASYVEQALTKARLAAELADAEETRVQMRYQQRQAQEMAKDLEELARPQVVASHAGQALAKSRAKSGVQEKNNQRRKQSTTASSSLGGLEESKPATVPLEATIKSQQHVQEETFHL